MLMKIVKSIGDLKLLKIHKTMFVSRREKDGPKGRERERKSVDRKGKRALLGITQAYQVNPGGWGGC